MNFMVQFVSHDAPSSAEKACSQRGAWSGSAVQVNRTLMGFPPSMSSAKNSPTLFEKLPTTGASRWVGLRPSSHQIDQVRDSAQYERSATARNGPSGK